MRVLVDPRRCALHGDCTVTAPAVFEIRDDSASSVVRMPEPPRALRAAVEEAARNCPTRAIRIED